MKWLIPVYRYALLLVLGIASIDGVCSQQPARPRLRVLTYNIHHGEGMDRRFDYRRLADIIESVDPDVVALQEVDRRTRRSSGVDQAAKLGELTGLHHVFGNAMHYQGGEYGEAVLSRFPIREAKAHHLPFRPNQEPRAALAVRVQPDNGVPELVFVGTHLCHQSDATRTEQAEELNDLFGAPGGPPIILAGDLNARPGSEPMKVLLTDHWVDAIAPRSRIDYVLYRESDPWRVAEVQILDERVASDHRPVLAVLEWHGERAALDSAARAVSGGPLARFTFDGDTDNSTGSVAGSLRGSAGFVTGLAGQALRITPGSTATTFELSATDLPFDREQDFSVRCWVRTTAASDSRMVLLSQKRFEDNSLASQKQRGWVFYASGGTWAWSMGSGRRRLTYERDNGEHMPLNDGRWHQLAMTYDSARAEVRLFYDGVDRAIYNVHDSTGFDFTATEPLVVGWHGTEPRPGEPIVPAIHSGAAKLQQLVDAFNSFGLDPVEPDELVTLIVEPKRLFNQKIRARAKALGAEAEAFTESMRAADFDPVSRVESELMRNPYTIHQAFSFMEAAPTMKIYSLVDGRVTIDEAVARGYSEQERLYPCDFDIDGLTIWDRALAAEEVASAYSAHFEPAARTLPARTSSITAGDWNIFHGGKHFTVREHGWDSRVAIAQILERENVDVVMMQETYSSGDFIAAELGYYFATTVDWDYLNQGTNISVLSRYPIKELHVQADSPFMNVGAKVAISQSQDLWVMSNWYGMNQFADVFEFHTPRFTAARTVPVIFGGDFNAIPHTDGGDSPASRALLDAGFTDAFRSQFPDVEAFPGASHRSGRRIDQIYYKGSGLREASTRVIDTWPTGFPSDHYLILTSFALD